MTPSLEGWPTKAKEAPSPHEVRLAPLDTNPVFQSLGYINFWLCIIPRKESHIQLPFVAGRLGYVTYSNSGYEIDVRDCFFNNYALKHFFQFPVYGKQL